MVVSVFICHNLSEMVGAVKEIAAAQNAVSPRPIFAGVEPMGSELHEAGISAPQLLRGPKGRLADTRINYCRYETRGRIFGPRNKSGVGVFLFSLCKR
jgi:hypothetical protein